jgi:haloalkane dehalogenase
MPFVPPPPLPDWLAAELPFARGGFRLERGADAGRLVHFIDHGPRDARPVVMVHGNPTWSFLWRKVIARLPEFRSVAPDLLGFGLSDKLRHHSEHSLARHGGAVAELIEALDLRGVVLVGQDWGGPIAALAGALLDSPSGGRIAGLVLANTAVILPARLRGTAFHRFARIPLLSNIVFQDLGFPLRSLGRVQGDPASISGPTARAYRWPLRRIRERAAPLALARMVPDGPDHPSVPALRRGEAWVRSFAGPIALVWGTRDPILGRALRRHEEALPAAAVTRTAAGHFLQEEVPDELAAAVRGVAAGAPATPS